MIKPIFNIMLLNLSNLAHCLASLGSAGQILFCRCWISSALINKRPDIKKIQNLYSLTNGNQVKVLAMLAIMVPIPNETSRMGRVQHKRPVHAKKTVKETKPKNLCDGFMITPLVVSLNKGFYWLGFAD